MTVMGASRGGHDSQAETLPTKQPGFAALFLNCYTRQQRIIDPGELFFKLGSQIGERQFALVLAQGFKRAEQLKTVISIHI